MGLGFSLLTAMFFCRLPLNNPLRTCPEEWLTRSPGLNVNIPGNGDTSCRPSSPITM